MDYSKRQKQLDVKKWVDSELSGYDTCGSYKYCGSCNKSEEYPCACAYEIYNTLTKLAKATSITKKATTTKSTIAKKTTTSKKTTATATAC